MNILTDLEFITIKYIHSILSIVIIMSSLGLIFSACTESEEPDIEAIGYDFFPLEVGNYRIYAVNEIVWEANKILPDTMIYDLKELISDSINAGGVELIYILQRWKRSITDPVWKLDSNWSTYRNAIQAVVGENGIPVIKLVFPLEESKSWDSNGLNESSPDDFQMSSVFSPYSNDFGMYESSVTVIQEEKLDSLIELDYRIEIFAKDIGLVEKVDSHLIFCQDPDVDCLGMKIVEEGRTLKQVLIEYGKE